MPPHPSTSHTSTASLPLASPSHIPTLPHIWAMNNVGDDAYAASQYHVKSMHPPLQPSPPSASSSSATPVPPSAAVAAAAVPPAAASPRPASSHRINLLWQPGLFGEERPIMYKANSPSPSPSPSSAADGLHHDAPLQLPHVHASQQRSTAPYAQQQQQQHVHSRFHFQTPIHPPQSSSSFQAPSAYYVPAMSPPPPAAHPSASPKSSSSSSSSAAARASLRKSSHKSSGGGGGTASSPSPSPSPKHLNILSRHIAPSAASPRSPRRVPHYALATVSANSHFGRDDATLRAIVDPHTSTKQTRAEQAKQREKEREFERQRELEREKQEHDERERQRLSSTDNKRRRTLLTPALLNCDYTQLLQSHPQNLIASFPLPLPDMTSYAPWTRDMLLYLSTTASFYFSPHLVQDAHPTALELFLFLEHYKEAGIAFAALFQVVDACQYEKEAVRKFLNSKSCTLIRDIGRQNKWKYNEEKSYDNAAENGQNDGNHDNSEVNSGSGEQKVSDKDSATKPNDDDDVLDVNAHKYPLDHIDITLLFEQTKCAANLPVHLRNLQWKNAQFDSLTSLVAAVMHEEEIFLSRRNDIYSFLSSDACRLFHPSLQLQLVTLSMVHSLLKTQTAQGAAQLMTRLYSWNIQGGKQIKSVDELISCIRADEESERQSNDAPEQVLIQFDRVNHRYLHANGGQPPLLPLSFYFMGPYPLLQQELDDGLKQTELHQLVAACEHYDDDASDSSHEQHQDDQEIKDEMIMKVKQTHLLKQMNIIFTELLKKWRPTGKEWSPPYSSLKSLIHQIKLQEAKAKRIKEELLKLFKNSDIFSQSLSSLQEQMVEPATLDRLYYTCDNPHFIVYLTTIYNYTHLPVPAPKSAEDFMQELSEIYKEFMVDSEQLHEWLLHSKYIISQHFTMSSIHDLLAHTLTHKHTLSYLRTWESEQAAITQKRLEKSNGSIKEGITLFETMDDLGEALIQHHMTIKTLISSNLEMNYTQLCPLLSSYLTDLDIERIYVFSNHNELQHLVLPLVDPPSIIQQQQLDNHVATVNTLLKYHKVLNRENKMIKGKNTAIVTQEEKWVDIEDELTRPVYKSINDYIQAVWSILQKLKVCQDEVIAHILSPQCFVFTSGATPRIQQELQADPSACAFRLFHDSKCRYSVMSYLSELEHNTPCSIQSLSELSSAIRKLHELSITNQAPMLEEIQVFLQKKDIWILNPYYKHVEKQRRKKSSMASANNSTPSSIVTSPNITQPPSPSPSTALLPSLTGASPLPQSSHLFFNLTHRQLTAILHASGTSTANAIAYMTYLNDIYREYGNLEELVAELVEINREMVSVDKEVEKLMTRYNFVRLFPAPAPTTSSLSSSPLPTPLYHDVVLRSGPLLYLPRFLTEAHASHRLFKTHEEVEEFIHERWIFSCQSLKEVYLFLYSNECELLDMKMTNLLSDDHGNDSTAIPSSTHHFRAPTRQPVTFKKLFKLFMEIGSNFKYFIYALHELNSYPSQQLKFDNFDKFRNYLLKVNEEFKQCVLDFIQNKIGTIKAHQSSTSATAPNTSQQLPSIETMHDVDVSTHPATLAYQHLPLNLLQPSILNGPTTPLFTHSVSEKLTLQHIDEIFYSIDISPFTLFFHMSFLTMPYLINSKKYAIYDSFHLPFQSWSDFLHALNVLELNWKEMEKKIMNVLNINPTKQSIPHLNHVQPLPSLFSAPQTIRPLDIQRLLTHSGAGLDCITYLTIMRQRIAARTLLPFVSMIDLIVCVRNTHAQTIESLNADRANLFAFLTSPQHNSLFLYPVEIHVRLIDKMMDICVNVSTVLTLLRYFSMSQRRFTDIAQLMKSLEFTYLSYRQMIVLFQNHLSSPAGRATLAWLSQYFPPSAINDSSLLFANATGNNNNNNANVIPIEMVETIVVQSGCGPYAFGRYLELLQNNNMKQSHSKNAPRKYNVFASMEELVTAIHRSFFTDLLPTILQHQATLYRELRLVQGEFFPPSFFETNNIDICLVQRLYEESGAGIDCLKYLKELHQANAKFQTFDELIEAIKLQHSHLIKLQHDIYQFFYSPTCTLFINRDASQPSTINIDMSDIEQLMNEGHGGILTLQILHKLQTTGKQYFSFADLIQAVAACSQQFTASYQSDLSLIALKISNPHITPLLPTRLHAVLSARDYTHIYMQAGNENIQRLLGYIDYLQSLHLEFESVEALAKQIAQIHNTMQQQQSTLLKFFNSPQFCHLFSASYISNTITSSSKSNNNNNNNNSNELQASVDSTSSFSMPFLSASTIAEILSQSRACVHNLSLIQQVNYLCRYSKKKHVHISQNIPELISKLQHLFTVQHQQARADLLKFLLHTPQLLATTIHPQTNETITSSSLTSLIAAFSSSQRPIKLLHYLRRVVQNSAQQNNGSGVVLFANIEELERALSTYATTFKEQEKKRCLEYLLNHSQLLRHASHAAALNIHLDDVERMMRDTDTHELLYDHLRLLHEAGYHADSLDKLTEEIKHKTYWYGIDIDKYGEEHLLQLYKQNAQQENAIANTHTNLITK